MVEAAFFDLDKTVIAKASMVAFGRPLLAAGMISRPLMVKALWSHVIFELFGADEERMRKFRESALRITAGWEQAKISAIVRDNLTEVIDPLVYDEALALIRDHQRAGRRVFIISASPEEIVAPLARYLGVDEVIASRARLDAEGRYTGDVEFYAYGPYKAEAMLDAAERLGIDLAASYAYSDSGTDIPMLSTVGHPVAVNPDRDLARTAKEREWEVQFFTNGVPLRERVSMPAPRRLAAVFTVLVALAGGLTLTWWWRRPKPPPRTRTEQIGDAVLLRLGRAPQPTQRIRRSPGASSPQQRRGRERRRGRGASS